MLLVSLRKPRDGVRTGALVLNVAKRLPRMPERKDQRFQSGKDLIVQRLLDSSTHSVLLEQNCTSLKGSYRFGFVGKISRQGLMLQVFSGDRQ